MKLALIGYGRMGHAIEETALKRGHSVSLIIDIENPGDLNAKNLKEIDVAIEFSFPEAAFRNISTCLESKVPVVSGTTGWLKDYEKAAKICMDNGSTFIHSSNYSIGVNILFMLNSELAKQMNKYRDYSVSIEEIHHTQKKDAPSGTAITLAEQVLENIPQKKKWINDAAKYPNELSIISKRIDPAPGTHSIKYSSAIDDIEIIHTAHNRTGFATGAVLAAEFIAGKKGIYTMKDVLGI